MSGFRRLAVVAAVGAIVGAAAFALFIVAGAEAWGGFDESQTGTLVVISLLYGGSGGALVAVEIALVVWLFRRSVWLGAFALATLAAAFAFLPATWYAVVTLVLVVPAFVAVVRVARRGARALRLTSM